jgi:hypothetical protein
MREIKIFVLDEADAMLDQQGLKDQTMRVHAYVPSLACVCLCVVSCVDAQPHDMANGTQLAAECCRASARCCCSRPPTTRR